MPRIKWPHIEYCLYLKSSNIQDGIFQNKLVSIIHYLDMNNSLQGEIVCMVFYMQAFWKIYLYLMYWILLSYAHWMKEPFPKISISCIPCYNREGRVKFSSYTLVIFLFLTVLHWCFSILSENKALTKVLFTFFECL